MDRVNLTKFVAGFENLDLKKDAYNFVIKKSAHQYDALSFAWPVLGKIDISKTLAKAESLIQEDTTTSPSDTSYV